MTVYHNEIDKACCAILRRNIGGIVDERSIEEVTPDDLATIKQAHFFAGVGGFSLGFRQAGIPADFNIWSGGFPCQDLSVAGKRKGLAGKRSGLYFEFHRLITSCYPRWVVLENVPGLLSSNDGRDFAIVVGGLTGIIPDVPENGWGNAGFFRGPVYSVAYRVLDAKFFGVAQRRRRVFVVASLGSGRCAEVLFERESLPGDTPPRRETGQGFAGVAGTLSANRGGMERPASNANELDFCVPAVYGIDGEKNVDREMIGALRSHQSGGAEMFVAFGGNNTSGAIDRAACLTHHQGRYDFESETFLAFTNRGISTGDLSETVRAGSHGAVPMYGVRRLTPTECERLQGFPDGWTDGQADSARYRQMGNAVAVPVIEWIGRRILEAQG